MDPAVGQRVAWQVERDIPQRSRAEYRPVHTVNLPVESRIRLAEARVARLMRQDEVTRTRTLQSGGDLLELDGQLGLEPAFDVGTKERCQDCTGRGQGEEDPDDRADEQPQT